jgi:Holliday junction resolvasome RuvABC endonuclease subunit
MSESVWGIDPGLSQIAVAFAPVDGGRPRTLTLITGSDAREGQRLGWLDRQVRIAARQWAGSWPPAAVWVEQPSGRFRNLQLTYATGVVQAALFEALAVPVWTIPSSTWKHRTVGVGNATKPQVRAWVERLGLDVISQDEADAVAIACAGRAMLLARSWEATAA